MDLSNIVSVFIERGPLAVVFLVLLVLFYNLLWKVWLSALMSKDKEIERLIELNKKFLELLVGSDKGDK